MIMPDKRTPVSRVQELGLYTEHMLAKFPDRLRLVELVERLRAGNLSLANAILAYSNQLSLLRRLRIDVSYENYLSDQRVRRTRKLVEIHDGRRGGRLAAEIFPDGGVDFARMPGAKQIEFMHSLETRVSNAQDIWPEAEAELADITVHRIRHAAAIAARDEGLRQAKDLRLARDAAKERFLQLYAEIAGLIAAEFPRDRVTQELFFIDARTRSGRPSEGGIEDELPDDVEDELPGDIEDTLPGAPAVEI
jgi:hypothetical protein